VTAVQGEESTRQRIVKEAIRLFAERGYRGTTVGEIEAAAGLTPRSGGLYKHFRSKEEVLQAAIERHVSEIEAVRSAMELMPLGDLRSELTLVARWTLHELKEEQELMRVVQKDGDQFPELVMDVHERIVKRGHDEARKLITRLMEQTGVNVPNPDALAAVALSSPVAYRIQERMFGVPPGGVSEDDFIEAWVDLWIGFANSQVDDATAQVGGTER
jgi:AcrR family transcriptional regulator